MKSFPAIYADRVHDSSYLNAAESPWPLDAQERGDVFHRIRVFPPDVRQWRHSHVTRLLKELSTRRGTVSHDQVRTLLDEGLSRARDVERILRLSRSTPTKTPVPPGNTRGADAKRVLLRLDLYRELRAQHSIQLDGPEPLPRNLGEALNILLSLHSRDVCKIVPDCHKCELRKFCGHYRRETSARAQASASPVLIDLFAGAGGLSEGFREAGFRSLFASDVDEVAMKTYRLNHPEMPDEVVLTQDVRQLRATDIRRLLNRRKLDVLMGAPPCQGFSSVGHRSKKTLTGYRTAFDERNYLSEYLVRFALELKPRLFLMENVPGIETARRENLSFLESAGRKLRQGGYRTTTWKLSASAYGVPQERVRCFLVGARSMVLPAPPREEYQNFLRRDFDPDALPRVTFDEATFDLPSRASGTGTGLDMWQRAAALSSDTRFRRYLGKFSLSTDSRLIWNHYVRYHNERDLELYGLLRPGEDSVHAIERHRRGDLMRYRRDIFDDKYARLRGDMPSKTIVAHLAKDGNGYIHPTQTRDISIREAARLQSFPDDFVFCGSPSDQWVQIGNAVPPILGEAIARSFLIALKTEGA